jgi:hypothetical protein
MRGFEQVAPEARAQLGQAVEAIDAQFGTGYAEANPALVAAFMQACALKDISIALAEIGALVRDGLVGR